MIRYPFLPSYMHLGSNSSVTKSFPVVLVYAGAAPQSAQMVRPGNLY